MIPENVLLVLQAIDDGQCNMFDCAKVLQIADVLDEQAADWLRANPIHYIKAVEIVRGRIVGDGE